jgi:gamma-glutamyltranspeptidase/glutathione hydrolase
LIAAALLIAPVLPVAPARGAADAARAVVIADEPLAAEAGLTMLRDGGSAVDAAIAAAMALAVLAPQSAGPGGGAFLLRAGPDGTVESWDGRETAPAAARPDLLLDRDGAPLAPADAGTGGRAVGVPGAMRALAAAHAARGRLPWATLLQPAIRLAAEGTALPPALAQAIAASAQRLAGSPAAALFLNADGTPRAAGERFANPPLAETLRLLATDGAGAFYRGGLASDIAAAVRTAARPGLLTADDLAAYQAVMRPPVCTAFRGMRVCGMGPPSEGGIAVAALLAADPDDAAAVRAAAADAAAHVADPDFLDVPAAAMIAAGRLASVASPPNTPESAERATQISVIDASGEAVALTLTLHAPFGSGLLVRGVLLNNSLLGVAARPVEDGRPVANSVEAAKRPRSAMSPTILLDSAGAVAAVVGGTGAGWMPAEVARAIAHLDAVPAAAGTQAILRMPDGLHAIVGSAAVAAE